jgi:hypothetical protein
MDDVLWKLCPFRAGNRTWAVVLLQGYIICLATVGILAFALNFLEGDQWMIGDKGATQRAYGDSALDECLWFTFMTLHGIGFGEFMPRQTAGHLIAMIAIQLCYWFMIFMMAIVLLSQLPGTKSPNLVSIIAHMARIAWPSYLLFTSLILFVGSILGPYLSDAPSGWNDAPTGIYWLWCVMHRAPYGDIWPNTPFARAVTVPAAIISYLYPPYVLAVIAVRRPTCAEHSELLEHYALHPDEAMGPGYIVPPTGREVQMVGGATL